MSITKRTTTRKKVKVIGVETYVNQKTGEIQEMQVISIQERDANFHKLWLGHIIQAMDIIGNQKVRFAFWLLDQMNRDNQITMTQRQMAKKSGMSLQTIQRTLAALIEANFLIKYNWGVYQVNPDAIFKGGKTDRMNILISYKQASNEAKTEKETEKPEETEQLQQIRHYDYDNWEYGAGGNDNEPRPEKYTDTLPQIHSDDQALRRDESIPGYKYG